MVANIHLLRELMLSPLYYCILSYSNRCCCRGMFYSANQYSDPAYNSKYIIKLICSRWSFKNVFNKFIFKSTKKGSILKIIKSIRFLLISVFLLNEELQQKIHFNAISHLWDIAWPSCNQISCQTWAFCACYITIWVAHLLCNMILS